jgi:hypothetical protein
MVYLKKETASKIAMHLLADINSRTLSTTQGTEWIDALCPEHKLVQDVKNALPDYRLAASDVCMIITMIGNWLSEQPLVGSGAVGGVKTEWNSNVHVITPNDDHRQRRADVRRLLDIKPQ